MDDPDNSNPSRLCDQNSDETLEEAMEKNVAQIGLLYQLYQDKAFFGSAREFR